jgi:small subunit ribosomal protein S20
MSSLHGKISRLSDIIFSWSKPLANTAQAKKRAKQAVVRRERNFSQKSTMRTAIKKVLKAVQSGDKALATTSYKEVAVLADRAVGKNLIHANKAARLKSRLNTKLKAIA